MQTKFTQSLPLLGTFIALIIGGAILFNFTPADAVMDATSDVPPTDEVTAIAEETDMNSEDVADEDEPEDTDELQLIVTPFETNLDPVKTKEIPGIYFAADAELTLADHYLNDVYVAGNTITITGTVEGDVFAAGEHIVIEGTVMGSVRVAGSSVTINGAVGRNVMVFAGNTAISNTAHIGADVVVYSGNVSIDAMVMGNVMGSSDQFSIDAPIEGDVNLSGVGTFILGESAYLMGDLTYTSDQALQMDADATVAGDIIYHQKSATKEDLPVDTSALVAGFKVVFAVISWLSFLLLGVVMLKAMPKFSMAVINYLQTKPSQSLGYGVLVIVVAPIALLIVGLTIIGFPLALAAGLTLILFLMASKVYAGALVGKLILKKSKGLVIPFLLGFTILSIVFALLSEIGFMGNLVSALFEGLLITTTLGAVIKVCKYGRDI